MLNREKIIEVLERIKNLKIVVVGDIMLDRYIWGKVRRISPEAPVPVVEMTDEIDRPGGAGNVVINITSLGAHCVPVSIIGHDRCGAALKEQLKSGNADISGLVFMGGRPTTIKTRVIADDQHVVRVDRETDTEFPQEKMDSLLKNLHKSMENADAVILQDYNKGLITEQLIYETISLANKNNIPVTVDPKFKNFFEYVGATLFKPNLQEAENSLGRPLITDKDVERAGNELLTRLQCKNVLITRGAKGMSLFKHAKNPLHIPSRAVKIHDVSGAGDTVISTLTMGLAAGLEPFEAAELANIAAEYVVGQIGVVPVTQEALLSLVKD